QALFQCVSCGFAGPVDAIAAENIRRAARMRSYAAGQPALLQAPGFSHGFMTG
ncbi:MAG: transposase, partial [Armatimonadota bacterium]